MAALSVTNMLKKVFVAASPFLLSLSFPVHAFAHCPLCTVGIVGGLTLTRWLGIDDIYSGIWIGALVGSISFWFGNSLKKKYLPYQEYLIFLILFLLTIMPFIYMSPSLALFGGSRLFTGLVVGGIVFIASGFLDKGLRQVNSGRPLVPYQGVISTIGSVAASVSAVFLLKV